MSPELFPGLSAGHSQLLLLASLFKGIKWPVTVAVGVQGKERCW